MLIKLIILIKNIKLIIQILVKIKFIIINKVKLLKKGQFLFLKKKIIFEQFRKNLIKTKIKIIWAKKLRIFKNNKI